MHGFLRMQKGILEEEAGAAIFITRIHLERPHIPNPISKVFAELFPQKSDRIPVSPAYPVSLAYPRTPG